MRPRVILDKTLCCLQISCANESCPSLLVEISALVENVMGHVSERRDVFNSVMACFFSRLRRPRSSPPIELIVDHITVRFGLCAPWCIIQNLTENTWEPCYIVARKAPSTWIQLSPYLAMFPNRCGCRESQTGDAYGASFEKAAPRSSSSFSQ